MFSDIYFIILVFNPFAIIFMCHSFNLYKVLTSFKSSSRHYLILCQIISDISAIKDEVMSGEYLESAIKTAME